MDLLLMMLEFFKTGLFAVGGGLATVPFLQKMSENYPHWFTSAELADMIAVAESTPGPIGVNMATFAGYRVAGVAGAVLSTLSLVLPSYIVICIVSRILTRFSENKYVTGSFTGIRPAVPGLICAAIIPLFWAAMFIPGVPLALSAVRIDTLVLFCAVFVGAFCFKKVHPLAFIALGAVAGIVFEM